MALNRIFFAVLFMTLCNANLCKAEDTKGPAPTPDLPIMESWIIDALVDCSYNMNRGSGSSDSCIRLTQFAVGGRFRLSERVTGSLSLSPFFKPTADHRHLSFQDFPSQESDTSTTPLVDYRLAWQAKPNLTLAIEQTDGSVVYPSVSGLSLASPFSNAAWYQTALTIAYTLPALKDSEVKFFLGNGEGENGENLDVQQYFGVQLKASIVEGLQARAGIGLDGNRYNSAATNSLIEENTGCLTVPVIDSQGGYESQRLGAGLVLDGTMPWARGLKGAMAYQRTTLSDLNKSKTMALPGSNCARLDPDRYFAEDFTLQTANVMVHEVYGLNLSYRILDRYFAAFDYQTRKIQSEHVTAFETCDVHRVIGACGNPTGTKLLEQTALSFGLGLDLEEGFQLIVDYSILEYEHSYRQFYYIGRNGAPSKSLEWLNLRISAQI